MTATFLSRRCTHQAGRVVPRGRKKYRRATYRSRATCGPKGARGVVKGADVATGAPWPSISGQDVLVALMPGRTRRRRRRGPRSRSVLGSSPWTACCKSRSSILSKRWGDGVGGLHGALTRPKGVQTILFAARARHAQRRQIAKRYDVRDDAGRGLTAATIVNESDQYKTAAVVLTQERPGAVRRRRAREREGSGRASRRLPPLRRPTPGAAAGARASGEWKAFVATADLARSASRWPPCPCQYELGDIDWFLRCGAARRGPAAHRRLRGAPGSRTALVRTVCLPRSLPRPHRAIPRTAIWRRRCGGLSGMWSTTTPRTSPPSGGPAIVTTTLKRCAGRGGAAPRDPDAELAEALRRSREPAPRAAVVKTDRDHPIVLDDSQDDNGRPPSTSPACKVEPARPSAEEVPPRGWRG